MILGKQVQEIIAKAEMEIFDVTGYKFRLRVMRRSEKFSQEEDLLKRAVCEFFHVKWEDIISHSRENTKERIVDARHSFMYLAFEEMRYTTVYIGAIMNRDHTTVIHAVEKIAGFYDVKDSLAVEIELIKENYYQTKRNENIH